MPTLLPKENLLKINPQNQKSQRERKTFYSSWNFFYKGVVVDVEGSSLVRFVIVVDVDRKICFSHRATNYSSINLTQAKTRSEGWENIFTLISQ